MATRKVYVRPGDNIVVHVVKDLDEPCNAASWRMESRPFSFTLSSDGASVDFYDPGLSVYHSNATRSRRVPYNTVAFNGTKP